MNYRLLSLLVLFFIYSCQPTPPAERVEHGISDVGLARYEAFLQQEVNEGRIAGAVSRVHRREQVAHNVAIGKLDITTDAAMSTDAIFYIQSMTKPIITAAFMMLYEEGHFFLNDPVSKYLPGFKGRQVALDLSKGLDSHTEPANKEITISHLLSHTAGLSHGLFGYGLDLEYAQAMYGEDHNTIEERVDRMLDLPLIGHPGEQWYYSAAPDVLSVLIAKFSGMSTADFLQSRLFDPLGMNDTGYNVPESKHDRVAKLHGFDSTGTLQFVPIGSLGGSQLTGNTIHSGVNALFSTAEDYLKFCQMILNNGEFSGQRYLSRKTIELMSENHVDDLFPWGAGYGFGYGFRVLEDLSETKAAGSVGIMAWDGAYSTYFIIDPDEELVAVLLLQLEPFSGYYQRKFTQYLYAAIDD
ncbi:MAG: beta-lactamase family protein [Cyclobacteriaceae bacterium]